MEISLSIPDSSSPLILLFRYFFLSSRAATPGSSSPPRNSSEAPPPVETKVTLSASPRLSITSAVEPPPMTVVAFSSGSSLASACVPLANCGISCDAHRPVPEHRPAFLQFLAESFDGLRADIGNLLIGAVLRQPTTISPSALAIISSATTTSTGSRSFTPLFSAFFNQLGGYARCFPLRPAMCLLHRIWLSETWPPCRRR